MSEAQRNAINAFLYRTGTPSKKVLFVLATNQPEQLDNALLDRVDQIFNFQKPQLNERLKLLYLYFGKYCDPKTRVYERIKELIYSPSSFLSIKKLILLNKDIDSDFFEQMAQETEGFSAREIEKFVIAAHDWAFSQVDPVLGQQAVAKILSDFKAQHITRQQWIVM